MNSSTSAAGSEQRPSERTGRQQLSATGPRGEGGPPHLLKKEERGRYSREDFFRTCYCTSTPRLAHCRSLTYKKSDMVAPPSSFWSMSGASPIPPPSSSASSRSNSSSSSPLSARAPSSPSCSGSESSPLRASQSRMRSGGLSGRCSVWRAGRRSVSPGNGRRGGGESAQVGGGGRADTSASAPRRDAASSHSRSAGPSTSRPLRQSRNSRASGPA